jgi:DNA-binding response OmpR family regulator
MNCRRIQVRFSPNKSHFVLPLKMMKPKIMLVDDDAGIREMLSRILTEEGYLVLPAANGQEALELAAAAPMDLVLLDLNLPVKNGWDTFERLTNENPLLPVIIITARSNQLMTALAAGAGALMEKPLDFPKLLHTIRALLDEPAETRLARIAGRPADFHYASGQRPRK